MLKSLLNYTKKKLKQQSDNWIIRRTTCFDHQGDCDSATWYLKFIQSEVMADLTYLRLVNTTTLFGLERMSSQRCSLNSRLIDNNNDDLKERISVIPSYHFVYLGLSSISDSIFQ